MQELRDYRPDDEEDVFCVNAKKVKFGLAKYIKTYIIEP
jgi:hypothetical protein